MKIIEFTIITLSCGYQALYQNDKYVANNLVCDNFNIMMFEIIKDTVPCIVNKYKEIKLEIELKYFNDYILPLSLLELLKVK